MRGGTGLAVHRQLSRSGTGIARPALAERLNRALDRGALLLVAGAGYGKTMAVAEALAGRHAASAWIRCTEADRDAGRLLRRVVDALRVTAPGAVDVLAERLAAAQERIDVPAIGDALVGDLGRLLVDPVVLVFDDAECLQASPQATSVVGNLLGADIAALRTTVATRRPLRLRLAKLRSTGQLTQLGPGDLAFSAHECEALLSLKGAPAESDVERLFAVTEGWPLGASLGAVHGGAPGLEGTSRAQLFDFLAEEVLDRLPRDLRELVIDASVPHELDYGCMRALGLPEDFPDRVARAGLPLRVLQPEPAWLAFHPLIREFLLERLRAERTPQARHTLHARVAGALAAAGRPEDAVEHWLAAEAWPQAAAAIATVGGALLHTAPATVRRWLGALPAAARAGPACLLLEGTLEWEEGRFAEAIERLRAAGAGFARAGDVPGEWLARFALADPLSVIGDWEHAIALADGFDEEPAFAAGLIPAAVAAYAAGGLGALGRVADCEVLSRRLLAHPHLGRYAAVRPLWEIHKLLLAGEFDELIGGAEQAVREFERFDPVNRLPILSQLLAVGLAHQGRDADAVAVWERVEAFARRAHMSHVVKLSQGWRALVHARAGQRAAAEEQLARAMAMSRASGWSEYTLDTAGARIAALRGDVAEAVAATERALALAPRAPLPDRFHATIELAPVLFEAGLTARARALVDEHLALCDARVPGAAGSYFRSLLRGVSAWLRDAAGDRAGALEDLQRAWTTAGPNVADVVRREWQLLEPLLWTALERGALDPRAVVEAVEAAWPGGEALLSFTAHPDPRVRRAAVAPALASGHPELIPRLAELTGDADPRVAAAATAAALRLRTTPPALAYTLLGGFVLRRGSWHVDDAAWDRRVAQRLVRYLLIHRGSGVPDDLLLEAFWPDKPTDSARRSLRVAVSCARAVLDVPDAPSAIEVAQGTLSLRLRERDSVDVDRFEHAVATALAARDHASRGLLEHAAALWTGEPLPEERYAEWTNAWRENLTFRYAEILTALVQACRADQDHPAATDAARKLVRLDPLDEAAHRELIASYARSGRRAHALRQYLECRRTLIDQLGVEPTTATTDLQQRILAGEPV